MTLASLKKSIVMLCATQRITEDAKDVLLEEVQEIEGTPTHGQKRRSFAELVMRTGSERRR